MAHEHNTTKHFHTMKYGSTLSKRSVPEWRAYNLDYNEIKEVIKKATNHTTRPEDVDKVYEAFLEQYNSVSRMKHVIESRS